MFCVSYQNQNSNDVSWILISQVYYALAACGLQHVIVFGEKDLLFVMNMIQFSVPFLSRDANNISCLFTIRKVREIIYKLM